MNKVKFGIIGTGAIAGVHAQALTASKKAELVRVYDTSSERAVSFAEKYGIEAVRTGNTFYFDREAHTERTLGRPESSEFREAMRLLTGDVAMKSHRI